MIITKQKEIESIIRLVESGPVFIIGCSECATLCNTGGEKEVKEMKKILEDKKIDVTGFVILDPACHFLNDKRILKNYKNEIKNAKKVLVLACGNGVQTVAELIQDIDVVPGTDTLFLGEIKRLGDFEKRCSLCGECIVYLYDGLCPISRCPKGMLNGPCGGSIDGKCEISKDLDCVWDLIFKRLKADNNLQKLKQIIEPIDWSKSTEMRRRI
jgi:ferredoxin